MITIGNRVINTDVQKVVETLLQDLKSKGIPYIRTIRPTGGNIQVCCPYHNQGLEKNPSAGILLKREGKNEAGTFHCLACGTVASLPELISYCYGRQDLGVFGERWLLDNFVGSNLVDRNAILTDMLDLLETKQHNRTFITEQELESYRFIHPYMYKRKLTDDIIEMFDVGYDKRSHSITFPCNDKDGNCLFIVRRSVLGKIYNMPEGITKPVYGLDKLPEDTKEVVVCESIINALTLWTWGIPAIALLGTGTDPQYQELKNLPIRKYILAFDGDFAGRKATTTFIKKVQNKLIQYVELPEGKDINDLTFEEYKNLKRRGI